MTYMKNNLPVKLLQNGLEEVRKSVERLFYWAAWADKFGGTVQETQIYGTVIKVRNGNNFLLILHSNLKPLNLHFLYMNFDIADSRSCWRNWSCLSR